MDTGRFPSDNDTAGLSAANTIQGKYVLSVTNASGVLTVAYGNDAHATLAAGTLLLSAATNTGSVEWVCKSTSILDKHLPAACR